jgi:hypothetical protein
MLLIFALALPFSLRAQDEPNLDAKQRIFSDVGQGFRSIRRGPMDRYYILSAPGTVVQVFDAAGKKIQQVPSLPRDWRPASFSAPRSTWMRLVKST